MARKNYQDKSIRSNADLMTHLRNHGSAQHGAGHWLWQRLTSLVLMGLMIWFTFALFEIRDAKQNMIVVWMAQPLNTGLLIATIGLGFVHAVLGMQVVIDDYIHHTSLRWFLRLSLYGVFGFLGLFVVLALLRVSALVTVFQAAQAG
ncbi:MAG: succinate dehydrogenase, hydrophobic membrane anchor protein [Candidatus Pacebacteria bacterium]|nr:succinate dehydrogenase, hydrophobic membrane anchor protein [Candidatus Paceibacterota bacterium]